MFQLAGQLGLEAVDTLAEGLPPRLPVAAELALVQLLLLEAGDGLPAEENLLLAARLLGLRLLAGHRQGDVTPLVCGALGIEGRQRLLGLGQFGLGFAKTSSPAPTVPSRSARTSGDVIDS